MNLQKVRFIAHALIKIDNKYLLIKRTSIKRGRPNVYPEYWDIPGGMVELNETPEKAAIRETKEEVNLNVSTGKILHEDTNFDKDKNTTFVRIVYEGILLPNQSSEDIVLQKDEHSEFRLVENLTEVDKFVEYLNHLI